jgi:hypothetical protein
MKWQARRDSNPQHPVLETGVLAVGTTGLRFIESTWFLYEEYASYQKGNTYSIQYDQ